MSFSGGRALRSWLAASRPFLDPNLPTNARAAIPTALVGALIVTLDQIVKALLDVLFAIAVRLASLDCRARRQTPPGSQLRIRLRPVSPTAPPPWLVSLVVLAAIGAILLVFTRPNRIAKPRHANRVWADLRRRHRKSDRSLSAWLCNRLRRLRLVAGLQHRRLGDKYLHSRVLSSCCFLGAWKDGPPPRRLSWSRSSDGGTRPSNHSRRGSGRHRRCRGRFRPQDRRVACESARRPQPHPSRGS